MSEATNGAEEAPDRRCPSAIGGPPDWTDLLSALLALRAPAAGAATRFQPLLDLLRARTASCHAFLAQTALTTQAGNDGRAAPAPAPVLLAISTESASEGASIAALEAALYPLCRSLPHGGAPADGIIVGHDLLVAPLHGDVSRGVTMLGLAGRPGGYDASARTLLAKLAAVLAEDRRQRSEADTLRDESHTLRNEAHMLRDETAALRDRERRQRLTIERAAAGIALTGADGRFIEVNERLCELLGRDRDTLIAMRFHDATHPDDLADDVLQAARLRAGEISHFVIEKRYLRPDGSAFPALLTVTAVRDAAGAPDHYIAVVQDLTPQRRAEQALREREEAWRQLSHLVPGAIFQLRLGADGRVRPTFVSPSVQSMLGMDADTLMQTPEVLVERLGPVVLTSLLHELLARAPQGEHLVAPLEWPLDGAERPRELEVSASAWRGPDGATLIQGFVTDVSERRAAAAAMDLAESAQRASDAKTALLSRVSHELLTPLNAVLGFAQLLRIDASDPLSPSQSERIRHIERAGRELLLMIHEVLDLSRLEQGELPLSVAEVDLRDALAEAWRTCTDDAELRGLKSRFVGPDARVAVDPQRLQQVLRHLLANAVLYNRREGHVDVRWQLLDHQVELEIEDAGQGMSQDELAHLFSPFYRGPGDQRTPAGGGLAMAFMRKIVEAMGGQLDVHSRLGVGTCLTLRLPLA